MFVFDPLAVINRNGFFMRVIKYVV